MPHKILIAGGALLEGTVEDFLRGLFTDNYDNQILVRVNIVVVPGIGRNLFSVMTAAKKGVVTIFDYKTRRWRRSTSPYRYGARAATSNHSCWT